MFRGILRGGKVYSQTRAEAKRRKDEEFGDILFSIYWGHIDDYEKTESWLKKGNDPNRSLTGYGTFFDAILNREKGFANSIELIKLLLKYKADPHMNNIWMDDKEVSAYDMCLRILLDLKTDKRLSKKENKKYRIHFNIITLFLYANPKLIPLF